MNIGFLLLGVLAGVTGGTSLEGIFAAWSKPKRILGVPILTGLLWFLTQFLGWRLLSLPKMHPATLPSSLVATLIALVTTSIVIALRGVLKTKT